MHKPIRTFIAIDIPDLLKKKIAIVQSSLQKTDADLTWVPQKNMHLTLKFLGDISPEKVPAITRSLQKIGKYHTPFSLSLADIGVFPRLEYPRVLWVGIKQGAIELTALVQAIETVLSPRGFPAENRSFKPHVTIGKIRSRRNKNDVITALKQLSFPETDPVLITTLTCYRSTLTPQGAIYAKLDTINLA